MKVYKISAITLLIKNMERSCRFYSKIPGFRLVYGGLAADSFSTYEVGEFTKIYLNLELHINNNNNQQDKINIRHFGRIIFHTEDIDKLYSYMKNNESISKMICFENEPTDAPWSERYFHIREPDGYQLSFAMPIKKKYQGMNNNSLE
jgi:catechol 2,3-dioxygenase-like lactoylglutathione lyase family enzyme